jgi:hypothetical protein
VIVPLQSWIDVILYSGSFSSNSSILPAVLSEHMGKHFAEPLNQRHRNNCVKICQAALDRYLLRDRRTFEAVHRCCVIFDRKTLAADAIKQYSGTCHEVGDYLAVLESCRAIDRGNLMDQIASRITCYDISTFEPAFELYLVAKRMDLASKTVRKFRHLTESSPRGIDPIVGLIKTTSSRHTFEDLKEWYVDAVCNGFSLRLEVTLIGTYSRCCLRE